MISTFYLIISVALVLAFFRIARLVGVRNRIVQKVSPFLTILELVLWTIIIFWSASIFLSSRSYYPILVITLAVLFTLMLTWFYLKDIVAGYIFRLRHNPVRGQILTCETVRGSVRMLGLSQLTIETDEGQWLRIPYSSVVTRSLSLQSPRQIIPGETTLELTVHRWDNPGKMERIVKKVLAQSPWFIASKPVNIQFIPEENKVRISFSLLNHVYLQLVKDRLESSLGLSDKGG
jgi:hypothetical protein